MELNLFVSMLGFLWVSAITPGPNNLLLTSSGASFGFKSSLWLMFGIMVGMQAILLLVACGVGSVIQIYPALHTALKILGSLYLLWLAWKIFSSAFVDITAGNNAAAEASPRKKIRFHQGALFQLLNPKAWLMTLGSVSSFSLPGTAYFSSILAISFGLFLVNLVAGVIWLAFGTVIGRLLKNQQLWKIFNICMGLITAACVLLIWY